MLKPAALVAQETPGIDEGAIEANAAFAAALTEAGTLLDNFNYSGLGDSTNLIGLITRAQALATSLPESERSYLRLRFYDHTDQVLQVARDYLGYQNGSANPVALAAIRDAMATARRDMSSRPDGRGLPAAILMIIAFSTEFGATRRMSNERAPLRALLDDYRVWAESMRNMQDGAIPFRRVVAAQQHDAGIIALAGTHFGSRLVITDFTISGSQEEHKIADPCVIVANSNVTFPFDHRAGVQMPQQTSSFIFSSFTPNVLLGFSDIKSRDDSRFGVRLIRFHPGAGANYSLSGYFLFHPDIGGEYCYILRSNSELSTERAFAKAEEHPSFQEDRRARTAIIDAIKNANACRIEIALSGRAIGMLGQFDGVRGFYERQL